MIGSIENARRGGRVFLLWRARKHFCVCCVPRRGPQPPRAATLCAAPASWGDVLWRCVTTVSACAPQIIGAFGGCKRAHRPSPHRPHVLSSPPKKPSDQRDRPGERKAKLKMWLCSRRFRAAPTTRRALALGGRCRLFATQASSGKLKTRRIRHPHHSRISSKWRSLLSLALLSLPSLSLSLHASKAPRVLAPHPPPRQCVLSRSLPLKLALDECRPRGV